MKEGRRPLPGRADPLGSPFLVAPKRFRQEGRGLRTAPWDRRITRAGRHPRRSMRAGWSPSSPASSPAARSSCYPTHLRPVAALPDPGRAHGRAPRRWSAPGGSRRSCCSWRLSRGSDPAHDGPLPLGLPTSAHDGGVIVTGRAIEELLTGHDPVHRLGRRRRRLPGRRRAVDRAPNPGPPAVPRGPCAPDRPPIAPGRDEPRATRRAGLPRTVARAPGRGQPLVQEQEEQPGAR
jgi:hypothetical protein